MDSYTDGIALYHHGVQGMKWGVWNADTRKRRLGGSVGGKFKAQRELNSLDKKLARKDAQYIRKSTAWANTNNPTKKRKLASEVEAINKERAKIESDTWKKVSDTLTGGYDIVTSDKIRDGRSYLEQFLVGGAIPYLAVSASENAAIRKSGMDFTAYYNGVKVRQTPQVIVGKKYKVYRREEGAKPTMSMKVKI